jgi:hypothetical protein
MISGRYEEEKRCSDEFTKITSINLQISLCEIVIDFISWDEVFFCPSQLGMFGAYAVGNMFK